MGLFATLPSSPPNSKEPERVGNRKDRHTDVWERPGHRVDVVTPAGGNAKGFSSDGQGKTGSASDRSHLRDRRPLAVRPAQANSSGVVLAGNTLRALPLGTQARKCTLFERCAAGLRRLWGSMAATSSRWCPQFRKDLRKGQSSWSPPCGFAPPPEGPAHHLSGSQSGLAGDPGLRTAVGRPGAPASNDPKPSARPGPALHRHLKAQRTSFLWPKALGLSKAVPCLF